MSLGSQIERLESRVLKASRASNGASLHSEYILIKDVTQMLSESEEKMESLPNRYSYLRHHLLDK